MKTKQSFCNWALCSSQRTLRHQSHNVDQRIGALAAFTNVIIVIHSDLQEVAVIKIGEPSECRRHDPLPALVRRLHAAQTHALVQMGRDIHVFHGRFAGSTDIHHGIPVCQPAMSILYEVCFLNSVYS